MKSMDNDNLAARPRTLFGYDVIDILGEGAGSTIYAVSDTTTRQIFAAKHVVRKNEKDIRFIEQLEAEYEVSRRFSSPYLRRSFDLKINRSMLRKVQDALLVMELFDGQPLERALPESLMAVVSIFIDAARGLDALHAMGYLHCDLKPNNILVSSAGIVKVIDFGQACPIGAVKERIQGTPDYIAPEQVRRQPVTIRTDVFNFGATLYWALTGRNLPTLFTVGRKANSFIVHDTLATPAQINPDIPVPLSDLVMSCVHAKAARRPANLSEIVRRLEIMMIGMEKRKNLKQPVVA
jgi:serine/threonine-protein kinase